jgi:hypothetical protein
MADVKKRAKLLEAVTASRDSLNADKSTVGPDVVNMKFELLKDAVIAIADYLESETL